MQSHRLKFYHQNGLNSSCFSVSSSLALGRLFGAKALLILGLSVLSSCQSSETSQILTQVKNEATSGQARQVIAGPLKPFKDKKFAYRQALEIAQSGDYLRAPYDEQFDINKRDELPVRKVRESYIKRFSSEQIKELSYKGGAHAMLGVGNVDTPSTMTVIYLHGRNGNKTWGFDDERFGGNFNRVKNLMVENGGAYLSPDFTDFEAKGTADIVSLLKQQRKTNEGKLVLACGSLGSQICWKIMNSKNASLIDGLILLGGMRSESFEARAAKAKKIPIYIAHGTRDKTFKAVEIARMYQNLHAKNYPVRLTLFETGNHGTPVRMIDWRQALNWIASKSSR
ncbi:MAG: alpha/beta hydrolase family protein [Nitratireductor sp.]